MDDFRRADDERWLNIQKEMLSLVAALRTEQQVSANREIEVQRLIEHVEDIDEHLRGVGGKESLDTRINIYKHTLDGHTNLLSQISRRISSLEDIIHKDLVKMQQDIFALQYQKSVKEQTESAKPDRLKTWLGFFEKGWPYAVPILAAILGGIYQMTHHKATSNVDVFIKDLQDRKKDPHVKKMLSEKYGDGVD